VVRERERGRLRVRLTIVTSAGSASERMSRTLMLSRAR
jgi:hypothetical protein